MTIKIHRDCLYYSYFAGRHCCKRHWQHNPASPLNELHLGCTDDRFGCSGSDYKAASWKADMYGGPERVTLIIGEPCEKTRIQ